MTCNEGAPTNYSAYNDHKGTTLTTKSGIVDSANSYNCLFIAIDIEYHSFVCNNCNASLLFVHRYRYITIYYILYIMYYYHHYHHYKLIKMNFVISYLDLLLN